jgi:glycosyltransferase involved in cell wall biosynthesis
MRQPEFAIIIPACDEASCIGPVLDELLARIDPEKFVVAVGVNGSRDRTAEIARARPVLVAETERRGYGHGCIAAIRLTNNLFPSIRAYLFFAGDGASEPRELHRLTNAFDQGYELVLGSRTRRLQNRRAMTFHHIIANAVLGLWAGCLGGRFFSDLGPLRLISRPLFEKIEPQEMTYGWTIEAQIASAKLGATICELPVKERRRIAGKQKVSGVSWRKTFVIGCAIVAAGWRTFRSFRPKPASVSGAIVLRSTAGRRPIA